MLASEEVRKQASLLDLTHDTIFVRDTDDVITYWNRGAAEQYGWSAAEAVGRVSHALLQTVFPTPFEQIEAELYDTGRWEGELIHSRRDGTQVMVASRWSLQRDEEGRPAGVLETNNDITRRRQAEELLSKAQAELAHVTRVMTLGEITASIAHEVNQPLAAVVMSGNACRRWLDADPPNLDEARQAAQRIIDNGNRASDVIRRIRSLLQRQAPEKRSLDVNDVVRDTLALTRSELTRQHVSVRTELQQALPPVLGDHVGLQQVLVNLILNGLDAMVGVTSSPRVLTIRTRADAARGVEVEVRDLGKGLDPEHPNRIFDPFFSTKPGGLGMGLSISRSIVEAHGGRLWATPNEEAGATLHFTLPVEAGAGSERGAGNLSYEGSIPARDARR
jgi:PAS domain S-box-containing protein